MLPLNDCFAILVAKNKQPMWRSLEDRIGDTSPIVRELVDRWWQDGANILPWLQRNYLASAFPGYDPTADRDDDTPYDVDHMVPASHWGSHWTTVAKRPIPEQPLTETELKRLQWVRHQLGNSIGNKWLVDYSTNRSWGDTSFETKLLHIEGETQDAPRRLLEVFPQDARAIWTQASYESKDFPPWNDERLVSFQRAVEHRAAWLYERLYEDLGFSAWQDSTPIAK